MPNLTQRPVYTARKQPNRAPNAEERALWHQLLKLPCAVKLFRPVTPCDGRMTIHHCGTGGGGRRNHELVLAICAFHHFGAEGIDGKKYSKRGWQDVYGSETELRDNQRLYMNASV